MTLKRSGDRLFEDPCHEGNYALRFVRKAVTFQEPADQPGRP